MEYEIPREQEAAGEIINPSRITVPFQKEVIFDGKKYTEIELNFETLTGNDAINAEREARVMGDRTAMLEASKYYQAVIAAKAAKMPTEFILALPLKEFSAVTTAAQNFLLG